MRIAGARLLDPAQSTGVGRPLGIYAPQSSLVHGCYTGSHRRVDPLLISWSSAGRAERARQLEGYADAATVIPEYDWLLPRPKRRKAPVDPGALSARANRRVSPQK